MWPVSELHRVFCGGVSTSFSLRLNSIPVCVYAAIYTLSVNGHLGCPCTLLWSLVLLCSCFQFFWGISLGVGWWNHIVILCRTFWGTTKLFSTVFTLFTSPPATHKSSSFCTSLPTLLIFHFKKNYSRPSRSEVVPHCGLTCIPWWTVMESIFSFTQWPLLYLGKLPVQVLCLFFLIGLSCWMLGVIYIFWMHIF